MKKIILIQLASLLLLVGIVALFFFQNKTIELDMNKCKSLLEENAAQTGVEDAGDMRVKRAFGLNMSECGEYLYYTSMDTMEVEEFFIVKTNNKEINTVVIEAMKKRLATQKKAFDGYGTNQSGILSKAIIRESGNYVYYIVSATASEWEKRFIKEGAK